MKGNAILSSLCYFSILFAPFIFPIIVYFVAEPEVKVHAKKALWTHLVPYIAIFLGFFLSFLLPGDTSTGIGLLLTFAITGILALYYFIWNILKGIKVLTAQ
ncbi:DUF4870 domain-containing protein [Priestia taiwanensis]|uniref:Membrane protein n=1 Tax=Priestia taiwanensis TaxID=1347902 RepID=A0A917AYA0_9BACI|nr:DUF4870 domain-containing protein [Priestia taiwanensis]MBM7365033.1 protein-S-isoprenylcysteine O-methyltransferase Ste14 [Priestia taiwanensis]GGE83547.1 membrane protein [Priestia taiwanensis]